MGSRPATHPPRDDLDHRFHAVFSREPDHLINGPSNLGHDGNLHPIVLYDSRDAKAVEKAIAASEEIIRYCVDLGGALTGEHGVGMEKNELMTLMFSEADFDLMRRVHDAFNPDSSLNPGKVFPLSKGCGEIRVKAKDMMGSNR